MIYDLPPGIVTKGILAVRQKSGKKHVSQSYSGAEVGKMTSINVKTPRWRFLGLFLCLWLQNKTRAPKTIIYMKLGGKILFSHPNKLLLMNIEDRRNSFITSYWFSTEQTESRAGKQTNQTSLSFQTNTSSCF